MAIFKGFVDDLRLSLVDTLILATLNRGQARTVEDVVREVRNSNIDLGDVDVESRIGHLDRNGHVKREGNNLRLTDDGREDINKVIPWFHELARKVGQVMPATTPGGTTGAGGMGGGAGGVGGGMGRGTTGTGTTGTGGMGTQGTPGRPR